jgi:hypothetical protein
MVEWIKEKKESGNKDRAFKITREARRKKKE